MSRIVRYGGTFYLFGYFRTLAHLLPILERHGFSLRQQIIVDKGMRAVSGRATANYRMYPCVTESILFMIKDPIPFSRTLLKEHQISAGLSSSDINKALGVKTEGGGMWSIYSGNNVCEQLPTREQWDVLQRVLGFECPYDSISPVFNTEMGITDVWRDIDFYSEKRMHPTQKPVRLIKRLIKVSSNEGDLVLDPFMGSGTVGAVAKALGRDFIGYEIDKDYFVRCSERIDNQGGLSGFLEVDR